MSVANARFTIGLGGDNALDLVLLITFIGEQSADAGDQADIGVGRHSVGVFPGRQDQDQATANVVDNSKNLAISTTFGNAYCLRLRALRGAERVRILRR